MPWSVALPLPIPAYDFGEPHGFEGPVPVGFRVLVPWQGELRIGIVVGESSAHGHRLRDAVALLEERPWLSAALVDTLCRAARARSVPLGLLFGDFVSAGWDSALDHRVARVAGADLASFGPGVAELNEDFLEARRFDATLLDAVRAQALLVERVQLSPRLEGSYRAVEGQGKLTPKGRAAWEVLRREGPLSSLAEWARRAAVSTSVVSGVVTKGWAQMDQRAAPPPPLPEPQLPPIRPQPHGLPTAAVTRLHGGRPAERHARVAARILEVIRADGDVLYLTPDAASRGRTWRALSGLTESVCYSGELTPAQREHAWELARAGRARLIVGSYAALALPLAHLRLIVLEDEGSDAYKLQGGSRAFVPDLARSLAERSGADLLLTGPVPSAEGLLEPGVVLPAPRARLHVVDYGAPEEAPEVGPLSLPNHQRSRQGWPLSNDLQRALKQVAERGRQAVLLAPRRGYSALLRCSSCGHTPMCRNCDVPLRFHAERRELTCHQCGYHLRPPDLCPACEGPMMQPKGPGTEWIAAEVRRLLPGFPVYRYDREQQDDLSAVYDSRPGVIVATQALLGLEAPPDLALIGLTFADTWLAVSDFRASERYHRLLRQLIEWHPQRAPLMVIQTFQGDHPALRSVYEGKDAGFYLEEELRARKLLAYPPYVRLAQVEVAARDQAKAQQAALEVAQALLGSGAGEREVLGPAPAPVARLRGLYAFNLLLRARDEERLEALLKPLQGRWSARVRVDVNPRDLLNL
ncbi:primosomal protein N' (replication factor Y) [Deinobacterium chartae]|uniref:Probable replication restart protein PriA n=1 Tax=Deinobacterium chartae TaxID=521158 RepID=A0A841I1Y4_9DEIO|nr:primosomal protein N' [Deinobacterium chartae]MBB6098338.1 primosomal protein N' (replication factor Y) [Deinobacterium chartae]